MKSRAKRESPLMKAAPLAAAKRRLRKIERSSIGALPRCSMMMKSGSRIAERIRLPITSESSQPEMPPRESP